MIQSAPGIVQRQGLISLLVAQAIVIAPLFLYLPLWLGLIWFMAVIIRVQVHRGVMYYPGNLAKAALAFVAIGGLAAYYGVDLSVEPMVGLLLAAFMLKLVEVRQRRDLLLIIFIGFVAIAAQLLFSQSMLAAAYGLLSALVLLIAWRACFTTRAESVKTLVKQSGALVLQALPLMIVLFLLLPRLGPLWAVPPTKSTGTTGFSDSMAPGDIAELSLSSAVAFRVSFDGAAPRPADMYWRGLVLDRFDGRRWSAAAATGDRAARSTGTAAPSWNVDDSGTTISYRIMLEPHQEQWLFFLSTPLSIEAGFRTTYLDEYLIEAQRPVTSRVEYRVTSDPGAQRQPGGLTRREAQMNLMLPEFPANPQSRALVEQWKGLSPPEVVQRALDFYHREFSYTLRPPPLGANSIDEFLFGTRKGFCEHFASSFVYLMRLAGIPARVVLGYQGGERSEVDNYWIVRQSTSHAWAEVWLEGQGWLRIDPTAAVAPERVEYGLREALGADEVYLAGGETLLGVQNWPWLRRLQHHWDAVGYAWHRAVLGYDRESQLGLLKRLLGGSEPWRVAVALLASAGVLGALYALMFWLANRRPDVPREMVLLRKAQRRLGVPREPHESPRQWAQRVAERSPENKAAVLDVVRLFEAAAYADQHEALYKLQQAIKNLRRS